MKVRRKSWHYRLHVLVFTMFNLDDYGPFAYFEGRRFEHRPRNLCRYFWSTVSLLVLMVAIAPIFIVVVGVLLGIFGAITVVQRAKARYRQARPLKEKPPKPAKPPKEPGIARQYLTARKRKMCPVIEVVDDR